MIERYDPFSRAMSLRQVMDRLLQDAFVMPRVGHITPPGGLALNVYEEGDSFVVEAQLPGTKLEDVEVTVHNGLLTIRGETKGDEERKDRRYLIRESWRGAFARSLRLPDTVDPDNAQAILESGVLRLVFPKTAAAKARKISVAGDGQQVLPESAQGAERRGAEQAATSRSHGQSRS